MVIKTYNDIVNFLSFATQLRKLRTRINQQIDASGIINEFPNSHPRGFIKVFKKRKTSIVETYLSITKSLDSAKYSERIHALSLLAEHIIYSQSLIMPLNAARVQLALMREVAIHRDNKRLQLELLRDFTVASFGHPREIRSYLKKLGLVEVPETGAELKDLNMGWDFHVHDNTSYGRKLPIQLIIDAFIKGISVITIAYNNLETEASIKELLEAGRILGIKVNIALEFGAVTQGMRFHYHYILPNFSSEKEKFKAFLKEKSNDFNDFMSELEENEKKRIKNIEQLIEQFNNEHLPILNEGYLPDTIYYLSPLPRNSKLGLLGHKIYSRRQLGEVLYPHYKKVLERRALQLTSMWIQTETNPHQFSKQEIENIQKRCKLVRAQYRELDPEKLRLEYFAGSESMHDETGVSKLEDIYKYANRAGGSIKLLQPLEHGLQAAVDLIFENYKILTYAEIYNMYGTVETKEEDFVVFANFIRLLNFGDKFDLIHYLNQHNLNYNLVKIVDVLAYFKENKLIPSIGSDAAGRSTFTPGMGFILENHIPAHQRSHFVKNHHVLPTPISELFYKLSKTTKHALKGDEKAAIVCLGKVDYGKVNLLGDEKNEKPIYPWRAWEYLHPAIKNSIFILIGFVPAYLTVGIEYALLWLGITGLRNMFVDVISGNGFSPRFWHSNDINWTNFAHSLFWTGFSVPILGFIKAHFDLIWIGAHEGVFFESTKFFCINLSNGIYLATHNYIRGFDKVTIRGNFFRSILAWPLAATFSPLGNTLMIPSIVQAKIWSDVVAAVIEGSSKYKNILKVKDDIMKKIVPALICEDKITQKLAMLDIIYFLQESKRAKTAFKKQLLLPIGSVTKLKNHIPGTKPTIVPTEAYYELKNRISEPGYFGDLINFIIANYHREQSIYLVTMISENYYSLQKWLENIDDQDNR
jgi:hypothetical protein